MGCRVCAVRGRARTVARSISFALSIPSLMTPSLVARSRPSLIPDSSAFCAAAKAPPAMTYYEKDFAIPDAEAEHTVESGATEHAADPQP